MKTPDGTILESKYRHDYVEHTDKVDGGYYMLDGGLDYQRFSAPNFEAIHWIRLTDESPYEEVRKVFCRGGRGKNGDKPLTWIPLEKMTDEHLEATIVYCRLHGGAGYIDLYETELEYRKEHGISISDPLSPEEVIAATPLAQKFYLNLMLADGGNWEKDLYYGDTKKLARLTNALVKEVEEWLKADPEAELGKIALDEEPFRATVHPIEE